MAIEEIVNFIQVGKYIASSGQPSPEQFSEIARAGYRGIVNLAMPNSPSALTEEGAVVTALGITYIHIPVRFDEPEVGQLKKFSGFMDVFAQEKVWVHCVLNYRASAFLFLYLSQQQKKEHPDFRDSPTGTDFGRQNLPEPRTALLSSWEPDEVWSRFMKKYTLEVW